MNIHEMAKELTAQFGLVDLECNDGKISLEIDNSAIVIAETADDVFILTGLIGDPPSQRADVFAEILLNSNMVLMNSSADALARNLQTDTYVLIKRVTSSTMFDFESLYTCRLETWRKMLAEFNTAAEESVAKSNVAEADALQTLRNNFMRV